MQFRDRIVDFRRVPASELIPNEANWRTHPEEQRQALRGILDEVGLVDAVLARETPEGLQLIDGHLRAETAADAILPVLVLDLDDGEAAKVLATFDPITAKADADLKKLSELLDGIETNDDGLGQLLSDLMDSVDVGKMTSVEEPTAAELPSKPTTKAGDLWVLGRHRLLCGDSTHKSEVERLTKGQGIDAILTDPPYCSGGFQEAGKSGGSVGRDTDHVPIANDRLSTRGYQALLKSAFSNVPAKYIYAFTDWRMWINLFDIAESCGYSIRSMIVWDKQSPGMGRGWRCQHELILWGCREVPPFDKHASGKGNVIQCARTGNNLHTTEKPVALIADLLETASFIGTCFDPFAGSGTTLIAAEQTKRQAFCIELDPRYCDVIVERWENLTGGKAIRE